MQVFLFIDLFKNNTNNVIWLFIKTYGQDPKIHKYKVYV